MIKSNEEKPKIKESMADRIFEREISVNEDVSMTVHNVDNNSLTQSAIFVVSYKKLGGFIPLTIEFPETRIMVFNAGIVYIFKADKTGISDNGLGILSYSMKNLVRDSDNTLQKQIEGYLSLSYLNTEPLTESPRSVVEVHNSHNLPLGEVIQPALQKYRDLCNVENPACLEDTRKKVENGHKDYYNLNSPEGLKRIEEDKTMTIYSSDTEFTELANLLKMAK